MLISERLQNEAIGVLRESASRALATNWTGVYRFASYLLSIALGWMAFSSAPDDWRSSTIAVWAAEYGVSLIPPLYARAWIAWTAWLWLWTLPKTRFERFGFAFAWHLGAAWHIALLWQGFFGNAVLGWLVLPLWAAMVASAYAAAPSRWGALALPLGLIIEAVIPPWALLGFGNPLIAAAGTIPGLGLAGLAIAFLSSFWPAAYLRAESERQKKVAHVALWVALLIGTVCGSVPDLKMPDWAWGQETSFGRPPKDLMEHFDRQDSMKSTGSEAIRAGVKLVVFPEGSNRSWTEAEASYWREISTQARASMASVLLGVTDDLTTFHAQDDYINALYDVASGRLYHAMVPMPIGVWHPWQPLGHVPMRAAFDPIRLDRGQAVYTICYEDTILLPALLRYLSATKPVAFVSAANQWFARDWLSEPQANSVAMTARWMGLPLVRAVAR